MTQSAKTSVGQAFQPAGEGAFQRPGLTASVQLGDLEVSQPAGSKACPTSVGGSRLVYWSILWTFIAAAVCASAATANSGKTLDGMVLIPAGVYRPLFRAANEAKQVPVKSFYLDTLPVTVGEYLEFVRSNPRWQRSQVKKIFADDSYLKDWAGDLNPGTNALLDAPVTSVSWFAAKAFAQWKGKRLPTIAEWELAAGASATRPDGENDPAFRQQVLQWYTTPNSVLARVGQGPANVWGVRDLHGLIWEWVTDFNTEMVTGDSRADSAGLERGLFCGAGAQGAKDVQDYPAFMRFGFRSSLEARYCVHNLGFRCAKDL